MFVLGCSDEGKNQTQSQQMPPMPVEVFEVKSENLPLDIQYTGKSKSVGDVEIHARVKGVLLKKYYTEGAKVKKDQLLYLIDPAPYQADLQAAQAEYEKAEKQLKRDEALYKDNAISKQKLDDSIAAYKSADASLKTARINLGYTSVKATIDGISGQKQQDIGSLVSPEGNSLLTTITQLDPIYVEFSIPNEDAPMLNKDRANDAFILPSDGKIKVDIQDTKGTTLLKDGLVDFTGVSLDKNTGSISARAKFENNDSALYPNQFGRVVLKEIFLKNALAVPQKAIMQSPQGVFVYAVDSNNTAQIVPVELGKTTTDGRWVIKSGIKEGDRVITTNLLKIRPKSPVQIVQGGAKAESSSVQTEGK